MDPLLPAADPASSSSAAGGVAASSSPPGGRTPPLPPSPSAASSAAAAAAAADALRQHLPPPPQSQPQPRPLELRQGKSPTSSLPSSRRSSFSATGGGEDEFPANVSSASQLDALPPEFLSGDPRRPLRYEDDATGIAHTYSLRPMSYSVVFILLVELLERFCFYGVQYTQTSYLTGAYDDGWNAGMTSVEASSLVSVSTAVAYSAPFAGAVLADAYLGDYNAVLFGASCLYIPGLFLIACTTVPGLLGERFNDGLLLLGLIGLWPVGTGVIKSVINVFGAKQHHPILQSSLIESYYVNFYMCINIGALVGGIIVPIVAQHNVTCAYFIPVLMLVAGVLVFVAGTRRYVRSGPKSEVKLCGGTDKAQGVKKDVYAPPPPTASPLDLSVIGKVSALIVPFNVAYSQMATTFIVQGTVMSKALGWIDAASMNNCDAVSVLFFGWAIGSKLYPELAKRNIKLCTAHKFAVGSALGTLAIGWALVVERMIKSAHSADPGSKVSVLWQGPSYVLIGAGEIFAVSSAYEVAFTVAPPDRKAAASAVNLFFVGAVPNFVCIGLYRACAPWFRNARGTANISHLDEYAEAHVGRYFALLFIVAAAGAAANLLPWVRDWLAGVEETAAELVRTPKLTPRTLTPKARRAARKAAEQAAEEGKPLLTKATRKHQQYLKYGKGPVLNRLGSMRAGAAALGRSERKLGTSVSGKKYVMYGGGLVLYKGSPAVTKKSPVPGGILPPVNREDRTSASERRYGSTDEERPAPPPPRDNGGTETTNVSTSTL